MLVKNLKKTFLPACLFSTWSILFTLFINVPLFANTTELNDKKASLQRLQVVQQDIHDLQNLISEDKDKVKNLHNQLRATELMIAKHSVGLQNLQHSLAKSNQALGDILHRIAITEEQRQKQAQLISKQIETQYIIGKQSALKLILNQEKPDNIKRLLFYLNYLNRARIQGISEFNVTLDRLSSLQQKEKQLQQQSQQLYQETVTQQQQLQAEQQFRSNILSDVEAALKNNEAKLGSLQKDEKQLSELIARLGAILADIPTALKQQFAFKKLQGKFHWPTEGVIRKHFGSKRLEGQHKWNGIIIAAPEGQLVRTIHSGQVAYADWLRGFGLLIIIDHGDGFMTLYAHNQSLYKDIGDWVEPNEVIATVGKTGGLATSGLYFEIRHNGKPTDPQAWIGRKAVARKST